MTERWLSLISETNSRTLFSQGVQYMTNLAVLALAVSSWLVPADTRQPTAGSEGEHAEKAGRFTFVRVEYDSMGGYGEASYFFDGRLWQRWQTDYPEAERNFLYRIGELSTVSVNSQPISLRLTDDAIFEHPFIYMCDVGWQTLSKEETASLRKYLERGGFLWVDDFWGDGEWTNFEYNLSQVFPDLSWREIPKNHAIYSMVFPLKECPQIPAKIFWEEWGISYDPPGVHRGPTGGEEGVRTVHFRGLFDKNGRLMAVATHNTDIGDGWEREGEDKEFFERFSVKSYAIGLNIIVFALTH